MHYHQSLKLKSKKTRALVNQYIKERLLLSKKPYLCSVQVFETIFI